MLPRRGLLRSAILVPPCVYRHQAAKRPSAGPTSSRRNRDTEPKSRVRVGLAGCFSSAFWCLVPHVVSGLATNIPYLNESGEKPHHPYGV